MGCAINYSNCMIEEWRALKVITSNALSYKIPLSSAFIHLGDSVAPHFGPKRNKNYFWLMCWVWTAAALTRMFSLLRIRMISVSLAISWVPRKSKASNYSRKSKATINWRRNPSYQCSSTCQTNRYLPFAFTSEEAIKLLIKKAGKVFSAK